MAHNIEKIANLLGAKMVASVPDTGGGAFGAARLAGIVARLRTRDSVDTSPTEQRQFPVSEAAFQKLQRLAARASTDELKISPLQLAAQLLEDTLANWPDA